MPYISVSQSLGLRSLSAKLECEYPVFHKKDILLCSGKGADDDGKGDNKENGEGKGKSADKGRVALWVARVMMRARARVRVALARVIILYACYQIMCELGLFFKCFTFCFLEI